MVLKDNLQSFGKKEIPDAFIQYMKASDVHFFDDIIFNGDSPLKNYGYEVGHKSKLTEHQRRCKLLDFWTARYGDKITDPVKKDWGRPCNADRLHKMALHIHGMISLRFQQKNKKSYTKAIRDWANDLDFLYLIYQSFEPNGKWPHLSKEVRDFLRE